MMLSKIDNDNVEIIMKNQIGILELKNMKTEIKILLEVLIN